MILCYTFLGDVMKKVDYIILGHQNPDVDSIISGVLLERYLKRLGYIAKFIIPDLEIDEESIDICCRYGINPRDYQDILPNDTKQKYILVDHFERDVLGKVVGVIDHHPTSKELSYPYYRNERASSTASMIVKGNEKNFTNDEICLAVLATMVDTVSFHSSKTLPEDIIWAQDMAKCYNFSYSKIYNEGLCLTEICSPNDFLYHGLKEYQFGDKKVASSSVLVLNPEDYTEMYPAAFLLIQDYVSNHNLDLFALLIHDMTKFQSNVYYISSFKIEKEEFDHFVSRGSEVIPELEKKMYIKK